jgi:hypothetical protein
VAIPELFNDALKLVCASAHYLLPVFCSIHLSDSPTR